jgi:hypothetical protein
MEVIGHNTGPDWPKLGPSMLIATPLVVAIRTARWAAKAPGAGLSDVDADLDREVATDFPFRSLEIEGLISAKRAISPCFFRVRFARMLGNEHGPAWQSTLWVLTFAKNRVLFPDLRGSR